MMLAPREDGVREYLGDMVLRAPGHVMERLEVIRAENDRGRDLMMMENGDGDQPQDMETEAAGGAASESQVSSWRGCVKAVTYVAISGTGANTGGVAASLLGTLNFHRSRSLGPSAGAGTIHLYDPSVCRSLYTREHGGEQEHAGRGDLAQHDAAQGPDGGEHSHGGEGGDTGARGGAGSCRGAGTRRPRRRPTSRRGRTRRWRPGTGRHHRPARGPGSGGRGVAAGPAEAEGGQRTDPDTARPKP